MKEEVEGSSAADDSFHQHNLEREKWYEKSKELFRKFKLLTSEICKDDDNDEITSEKTDSGLPGRCIYINYLSIYIRFIVY